MRFGLLFFILLTGCSLTQAQVVIDLPVQPVLVATDRPGDFYVIDAETNIKKFGPDGKLITTAALDELPALFDPWSGVRLFAYYPAKREIQYLNPSLELISVITIDSAFAIDPTLASPSGEYNYWLFDQADHSIKKILSRENTVQVEVPVEKYISGADQVVLIREYLNYFFILDQQKGIIIFNSLGIYLKTIPVVTHSFGFYGEELYFLSDNRITFIDLYNGAESEVPLSAPADTVLLLENKQITVKDKRIWISDFQR